jgi:hypothetical protein
MPVRVNNVVTHIAHRDPGAAVEWQRNLNTDRIAASHFFLRQNGDAASTRAPSRMSGVCAEGIHAALLLGELLLNDKAIVSSAVASANQNLR